MNVPSPRALHRALVRTVLAAVSVYVWIFIFQYFYVSNASVAVGLYATVLVYALAQVVTVLLTPLSASRTRYGFRRMLVYAMLSLATAYAILAASFSGYGGSLGWGIWAFAVLVGAYRALYWVPYSITHAARARRFSYGELFLALIPAIVGLLLAASPIAPIALLCIAAILSLIAILPLAGMREVYEAYAWGYRETFHELFSPERRTLLWRSIAAGIEGAALLLLWPLVIFLLLGWSYFALGLVLTVTFLITMGLRIFLRKRFESFSTPVQALVAASAWVLRLGVASAGAIVLVDTYFYVSSRVPGRSIDTTSMEQMADNATYIDEHTALKEMGLALGRLVLCLIVAPLVWHVALSAVFIAAFTIAALAAAFSVVAARKEAVRIV